MSPEREPIPAHYLRFHFDNIEVGVEPALWDQLNPDERMALLFDAFSKAMGKPALQSKADPGLLLAASSGRPGGDETSKDVELLDGPKAQEKGAKP